MLSVVPDILKVEEGRELVDELTPRRDVYNISCSSTLYKRGVNFFSVERESRSSVGRTKEHATPD